MLVYFTFLFQIFGFFLLSKEPHVYSIICIRSLLFFVFFALIFRWEGEGLNFFDSAK